eukprot:6481836-Amphidinium_carterae.2
MDEQVSCLVNAGLGTQLSHARMLRAKAVDGPFVALVQKVLGDVSLGIQAIMRQLLTAAATITDQATRTSSAPPKAMPHAEREDRMKALRSKLV